MKTLSFKNYTFLISLIILSFYSCSQGQDATKLSQDKVNTEEIETGKAFIHDFYDALEGGGVYEFKKENATELMISTFSPNMQREAFEQIRKLFGEYEDSEYVEAWAQSGNPDYKILRFKGDFTESNSKVELRVVLDEKNKLAGFFIKSWSDMFM